MDRNCGESIKQDRNGFDSQIIVEGLGEGAAPIPSSIFVYVNAMAMYVQVF
jgi:hypothetical protein